MITRGRNIAESEGNPLALLEYLASLSAGLLTGAGELPPGLPVTERLSAVRSGQGKALLRSSQRQVSRLTCCTLMTSWPSCSVTVYQMVTSSAGRCSS